MKILDKVQVKAGLALYSIATEVANASSAKFSRRKPSPFWAKVYAEQKNADTTQKWEVSDGKVSLPKRELSQEEVQLLKK